MSADRLAGPFDLLIAYEPGDGFAFERHGRGVVSRGAAARIVVPAGPDQVARAASLAADALERVGRPKEGPAAMVVGALPFDGLTPATLVIPLEAVVRERDGEVWRVRVDAEGIDRR